MLSTGRTLGRYSTIGHRVALVSRHGRSPRRTLHLSPSCSVKGAGDQVHTTSTPGGFPGRGLPTSKGVVESATLCTGILLQHCRMRESYLSCEWCGQGGFHQPFHPCQYFPLCEKPRLQCQEEMFCLCSSKYKCIPLAWPLGTRL